eukprot:TRINITY_DN11954_c0_g5_i1.p1 TRINITY_DN11954_c0_g5~~TRINITY_DN11954_c0_g5_i1.p1  ORF type:complete len:203 (+),score=49.39 TRINITY_DN11954_c0_g5_i1:73-681(+)
MCIRDSVGTGYVNELLHSVLKEFVIEFLVEYNEKVKALISHAIFNQLQERATIKAAKDIYLDTVMASIAFNSLLKENIKKSARKVIQDNFVIANSIKDQTINKAVKSFVKSTFAHNSAINSIAISFLARTCYKQLKSQLESIRSDIVLDKEMSLEDMDDSPRIDMSSRSLVLHSLSPSSTKSRQTTARIKSCLLYTSDAADE